jgi:uncharacterized UPF0146 family protein
MDQKGQVFVFGEIHGAEGNVEYLKGALTKLSERGVKNFAIELPEDAQDAFSSKLAQGAQGGAVAGVFHAKNGAQIGGVGDYLILASHARRLGMDIHCVDAPRCPEGGEVERIAQSDRRFGQGLISEDRYVSEVQGQFERRNKHMAEKVSQIGGGTVLVTGMFHTGGEGSVEQRLRERGMDVVTVDLYPQGKNPTVDIFERNESPQVDIKVKNAHSGPSNSDIEGMIGRLRGGIGGGHSKAEQEPTELEGVEVRRAIPLRRGGVSFAPGAGGRDSYGM